MSNPLFTALFPANVDQLSLLQTKQQDGIEFDRSKFAKGTCENHDGNKSVFLKKEKL